MKTRQETLVMKAGSQSWELATLWFLLFSTLLVCSCASSSHDVALAPAPPSKYPVITDKITTFTAAPEQLASIEVASGGGGFPVTEQGPEALGFESRPKAPRGCSIRDRFDKRYMIAYQWGEGGQNKLGIDMAANVGFGNSEFKGARLEYSLRLQPEIPRQERCRYASRWQGLVGSGYHEFFVRDTDTVWTDLNIISDDISSRVDTLLDQ